MKTRFLIIFLLLIVSGLDAQPRRGGNRDGSPTRERIRAQRVAFITERLALTTEEAQRFWPVYNQFTDEWEQLKKQQNTLRKNAADKLAVISDADAAKMLEEELAIQQKMVDVQRKYQASLQKVISVKKVVMLYKAERDFKLELLKRLGGRGGEEPDDGF